MVYSEVVVARSNYKNLICGELKTLLVVIRLGVTVLKKT